MASHFIPTSSDIVLVTVTFAGFFICGMLLFYNITIRWLRSICPRYRRQSHWFHRCHLSCPIPRHCQKFIVRGFLFISLSCQSKASSNSGMWGCIPMIFLRSTVALLWTAISVVQVSKCLHIIVILSLDTYYLLLGWGFPREYDFCYLAQISDLESSSRVG